MKDMNLISEINKYLKLINDKIESIKSGIFKYIEMSNTENIIKYSAIALLAIITIVFAWSLVGTIFSKQNIERIENIITGMSDKDKKMDATRAEMKSIYGEIESNSFEERTREIVKYSGLTTKYKWLSVEVIYTLTIVFGLMLVVIIGYNFNFFSGILTLIIAVAIEKIVLEAAGKRRDRKIEMEMINFMSLVRNYSITSGNISTVIKNVKELIDGPLREELDRYCMDLDSGSTEQTAFEALIDRIGSSQTKLVLRDIQSVSKFETDYNIVIELCETQFQNFLQDKREKRKIRIFALFEVIALVVLSIICINITVDITTYKSFFDFVDKLENKDTVYTIMIVAAAVGIYIVEDKLIKEVL